MPIIVIAIIPIFNAKIGLSYNVSLNKPKIREINLVGKKAKLIKIAKYFGFEYFVNIE